MLSFLKSSKKGSVLGLDIGTATTKIIHLISTESKVPLVNFASILELPRSDPKFEHTLREVLQKNKLTGLPTAFGLEDASFKIRKVELPKMPDGDLKEAVKWKMRDVVDGKIEEFIVRHSHVMTSPDGKRNTLVGYASRKMAVAHVLALADRLTLNAQWIEPTAVNLSAAIEACTNPDDEWVAGIDLGESKSILVILGNGKFYFSRPLAGVNLSVSRESPETFNQKLAAEIQNSLDTFAVTFHVEQIGRLYLAGGGALIPGLQGYLTQNLGIPTQLVEAFKGLEIKKGLPAELVDKAPLMAMAVALSRVKL